MIQHPVQPYKGLSPCTAVAKTGVPGGETTAEKLPENYLKTPQRVPHNIKFFVSLYWKHQKGHLTVINNLKV